VIHSAQWQQQYSTSPTAANMQHEIYKQILSSSLTKIIAEEHLFLKQWFGTKKVQQNKDQLAAGHLWYSSEGTNTR
jgi:hypothetical protein